MSDLTVANTIHQQLGGNRFAVMTGAKDFVGGDNFLAFKLPAMTAKKGINYVKITLTPKDLYHIEFGKITGTNYKVIDAQDDIYAEILRSFFSEITGLYTHL